MLPSVKKRKHSAPIVEEVKFDDDARADYLTGFHKRKVQRVKHAQEQAVKQDKAERIEARKRLRETRKADLEKHVETVNQLLKEANSISRGVSEESGSGDSGEEWTGLDNGLNADMVDHEEEYLDEDKFTIVTIENVEVTKDGLEKQVEPVEHSASDDESKTTGTIEVEQSLGKARRIWTTEKPDRPKKKKKKFRYENKADRKLTRHKERAGSRAQAMARRQ